ncbi:MAG: response regulator [Anaerolineales bacterium]|jgi:CheY-like chemotaxis protein|nr:response regulator [Anaerolineales bacterium]NTW12874.1 response regulator [Anaerolineales bacterium]
MKPNILYIEDHPDNMTLVRRILCSESYNLIEAQTGFQGIHIAENQDVDVILLDINLPDIDGYEVALRLRNSEKAKLSSVPIIAVTANAMKGDAIKALGAGCDFYISKPINIQELLEKVEEMTTNKI